MAATVSRPSPTLDHFHRHGADGYTGATAWTSDPLPEDGQTLSGRKVALVPEWRDAAEATRRQRPGAVPEPLLQGEGPGAAKMVMAYGPQGRPGRAGAWTALP